MILYKISIQQDFNLKKIFNCEIKDEDRSSGYTYSIIENDIYFRFESKAGAAMPVSQIYLTIAGDSIQNLINNDSIVYYHLQCKNFSIRYKPEYPIDIFVVGKDKAFGRTIVIPMDLLFLKRNDAVYLILMTPIDANCSITPYILYNIVVGIY